MIPTRRVLLAMLAVATVAAGADSELLGILMPDARFVAGVRVEQARNSPFGQFFLNQIQNEEEGLRKLIDATGFDPRTDLTEVVFASSSETGHGKGLAIARGKFDIGRITNAARAAGASMTNYLEVQVITNDSKQQEGWLALLNSTTALAGDAENVKAAIDRIKKPGSGLSGDLLVKANRLSGQYDIWVASTMGLSKLASTVEDPNVRGAMNGNVIQAIESASGGVRFGANVQVDGEAVMRSEKDATALVDVSKFLAGMVQLSRNDQRGDPRAKAVAGWLETMTVTAQGNTVKMSLTIPENEFEGLIKSGSRPRRQARVAQ